MNNIMKQAQIEFKQFGTLSNGTIEKLLNLDMQSAYGDGYFNGFIDAQDIYRRSLSDTFLDLLDYKADTVLEMSETAESESEYCASMEIEEG